MNFHLKFEVILTIIYRDFAVSVLKNIDFNAIFKVNKKIVYIFYLVN